MGQSLEQMQTNLRTGDSAGLIACGRWLRSCQVADQRHVAPQSQGCNVTDTALNINTCEMPCRCTSWISFNFNLKL